MLSLRYFMRGSSTPSSLPKQIYSRGLSTSSHCNSDRKDPPKKDKSDENSASETKKSDALKKLNKLLNSMVGEEYTTSTTRAINKQMARPKRQPKPKSEPNESSDKLEPLVTAAAKNVAESFGGDVQQTESELLTKLRSTKSNESKKSPVNLSELIVGMKIDRTKKKPEPEGRASQVRRILDNQRGGGDRERRDQKPDSYRFRDGSRDRGDDNRNRSYREERRPRMAPVKVDLFKHEALGIFTAKSTPTTDEVATVQPVLATWDSLYERELRLAVTHPPSNVFEEMILWTEQGKLWKFPIDNEQDLDAERQVYFADHVFLEPQLDAWCPRKGPVRHFMELVCVGLSKNPYLSVAEKRDHIAWFRQYFDEKRDLLKESGVLDSTPPPAQDRIAS